MVFPSMVDGHGEVAKAMSRPILHLPPWAKKPKLFESEAPKPKKVVPLFPSRMFRPQGRSR